MYWFREGIEYDVSKMLKLDSIGLLIRLFNEAIEDDQNAFFFDFQEKWEFITQHHRVVQDQQAFDHLPPLDQVKLAHEFLVMVKTEKEQSILYWHQELKPWAIRLQELVVEQFELPSVEIDRETTKVMCQGKSGSYLDFCIPISRSFNLLLFSSGCVPEHDTHYPNVYAIQDKKREIFSMNGLYPEHSRKNIRLIQGKNPRKFQEFLLIEKKEKEIWKKWHQELKDAGVEYEPIFRRK